MPEQVQNYSNHTRWFPPFHFFVIPVLLANVLVVGRHVYYDPSRGTVWSLIVAIALLMTAGLARQMVVSVQDRVIRLEMRLRLHEVLPADLHGSINALTARQLVALRFASDAELEALVRDTLAGKLTSQKAIKLQVKNWQGDFLRA
jgi:hypothetical protein